MAQPVDLQTEVARVTAAERILQIADRASLASQHRAQVEEEAEHVRQESQVQDTERTEQEALDKDGRGSKDPKRPRPAQTDADEEVADRDAGRLPVIPDKDAPHFDVNV